MKQLATAVTMGAALALAACAQEPAPEALPEGVVPGVEISDARMVLAPVAGNPAAIYFTAEYTGDRGISITAAEVAGAGSAELHDTMEYNFEMTMGPSGPVPLIPGEAVSFEPGGKHIMAFDVAESVEPGSTTEVTLNIVGGKKHKFEAEVRAAGEER